MAERAAVLTKIHETQQLIVWSGLLTTDTGAWVQVPFYSDKTVQVSGATGTGGLITIEGTNQAAPLAGETIVSVLDDIISNTPLSSLGLLAMGLIGENPLWIRPIVVSGDGTTNFKVAINAFGKRAFS